LNNEILGGHNRWGDTKQRASVKTFGEEVDTDKTGEKKRGKSQIEKRKEPEVDGQEVLRKRQKAHQSAPNDAGSRPAKKTRLATSEGRHRGLSRGNANG